METDGHSKTIVWQKKLEDYFCQTGEKAHCLSWLHKRAEEMYSARTIWIDLPVIILGTLNGAVSVGSQSLFGNSEYASVGVGAVALVTAILSTVGSYFSWSRRAEGHRISALNYAKLYRFLTIELSLPQDERMSPADLLKYVKTEYDRLSEISPLLPPNVIADFKSRFNRPEYDNISKPEDANGLHAIQPFSPVTPTLQVTAVASPETNLRPRKDVVRHSSSAPQLPALDPLTRDLGPLSPKSSALRDSSGVQGGTANAKVNDTAHSLFP